MREKFWLDFFASMMLITCVLLGGLAAMCFHWWILSGFLKWLLHAIC